MCEIHKPTQAELEEFFERSLELEELTSLSTEEVQEIFEENFTV